MNFEYQTEKVESVENGIEFVEETTYRIFENGEKEIACQIKYPVSSVVTPN